MTTVFEFNPAMMEIMVPAHLRHGLTNYITSGVPNGAGLTSIIANAPVHEVVRRCDPMTLQGLVSIIGFLQAYCPAAAHGSQEAVDAWVKAGGILGQGGVW